MNRHHFLAFYFFLCVSPLALVGVASAREPAGAKKPAPDAGTPTERCASSAADAGTECAYAFAEPSVGVEVYIYSAAGDDGGEVTTAGVGIRNQRGWVILPTQLPVVGGVRSPAGIGAGAP
jgi:hypothetical protein